ncbi:MAG TPA: hypothetical protein VHM01_10235 [Alphaproteobacteria bacterium]|nr:hypothetical protein [Alphaproteobacteria bacterium]
MRAAAVIRGVALAALFLLIALPAATAEQVVAIEPRPGVKLRMLVERKKYGRAKARRSFQFSKR